MAEPAYVVLDVTHSVQSRRSQEIKFNLTSTIEAVKNQLYSLFGTEARHQELALRDSSGATQAILSNDAALLASYNPLNHWVIHITDSNPQAINFENVEDVKKFELSEEAYNARPDNVRALIEKKRAAQGLGPLKRGPDPELGAEAAAAITVGSRCSITPGDKRGEVAYVGKVPEAAPGYFIGVKLDEPLGKNDGSVKGVRYFECMQNFGTFARPDNVTVGDFQPFDFDEI